MPKDELIAALERATADSAELMIEAFKAIYGQKPLRVHGGSEELSAWLRRYSPFHDMIAAKAYESAALTLVPEGWGLDLRHPASGHLEKVGVETPKFSYCRLHNLPNDATATASTPALAIVIAALATERGEAGR